MIRDVTKTLKLNTKSAKIKQCTTKGDKQNKDSYLIQKKSHTGIR